ncbi:hypothetical protein ACFLVB_02795 [Chloroflexota bacterium]
MGIAAAIIGAIGGLCAIMGIVTATEILVPIMTEFTWTFWFMLSAVLLLSSIALALGRSSYD